MEFAKGLTLPDILIAIFGIIVLFVLILANFQYNLYIAFAWACCVVILFLKINDELRVYATIGLFLRFIAFKKKYNKSDVDSKTKQPKIKKIIPFEGIIRDKFIDFKDYYGMVLEIKPIEFGLLNEQKQEMVIQSFANALRRVTTGQSGSIIKLSKALIFDDYITGEDKKYDDLMELQ